MQKTTLKEKKKNVCKLEYWDNYQDTVDYKRWKAYYVNGNQIKFGNHPTTDIRFTAYLERWIEDNGREPKEGEVIYECNGYVVDDVWTDIQAIDPKDTVEKYGYPTQKPVALYQRIIKAASNENDMVLDAFCGCVTTCVAAEQLDRQWIGIDIWDEAHEAVWKRLMKECDIETPERRKTGSWCIKTRCGNQLSNQASHSHG